MSHAMIYVCATGGLLFLAGLGTLAVHRLSGGPQEGSTLVTGVVLTLAGLLTLVVGAIVLLVQLFTS